MANSAAGAGVGAGAQNQSAATGANPFQIATNLYAEKNLQGALSGQVLTGSAITGGGSVNAGQYLRALRMMFRTTAAGTGTAVAVAGDAPWSVFSQLDLTNVDGSEILYNMPGYSYYIGEKYFRSWLCDPGKRYDYQAAAGGSTPNAGSFTLSLQPEIRFTAGVLANTDTRSQYRFDYGLNGGTLFTSGVTTYPTVALIPYMDAWAQPDAQDLQGTPNQPVPPGVNLQIKRRHQIFTLNGAGSDNTLLSTLTGNAIRAMALVVRAGSPSARTDGFTDPFYWYLDNRSLGRLNPDMIRQWAEDFYSILALTGTSTAQTPGNPSATSNNATDGLSGAALYSGAGAEDQGVYVFPRWIEPGELYGQGWLYTANSTKLQFESSSASGIGASPTAELITDEVYPIGAVDPSLVDI
jgi:hypothetical protein